MGLLNRVLEPASLLEATYDYARTLATEISPASLATSKLQMYLDLHRDAATAVDDANGRLDGMMKGPTSPRAWPPWPSGGRRVSPIPRPGPGQEHEPERVA